MLSYEGPKGEERLVAKRERKPDGYHISRYEGEAGAEYLVRVILPNGDVERYAGPRGQERLVHTEPSGFLQGLGDPYDRSIRPRLQ